MRDEEPRQERLLTWKGGGWILALAAVPVAAILLWAIAGAISRGFEGRDVASTVEEFNFDLDSALIPVDEIVIGAGDREAIHPIDDPEIIEGAAVRTINEAERGKYLVSGDRVIGVTINGESRAYPIRMLDWHEVVNDTMQGVPIAITYNGLCDSAVVFDRRVGNDTLLLGVSGLLYNSNHLLFDRAEAGQGGEGLWLQLQARAVTGAPAESGRTLRVLPATVCTWRAWLDAHPGTLVLAPNPDPTMTRYYKRRTYGDYFSSDRLQFDVSPLPTGDRPLKTPTISVLLGESWRTFSIPALIRDADSDGIATRTVGGRELHFGTTDQPPTAWMTGPDACPTAYAFWFAWYAMHPETTLIE